MDPNHSLKPDLLRGGSVRLALRKRPSPATSRLGSTQVSAAMNPSKVVRNNVRRFTDLPNIGPAGAKDFELLGYTTPDQLQAADPLELYHSLCLATGVRQDPCVLDVFMSVTSFLQGNSPEPWWHFTEKRKKMYGQL
jgi:hypothetical protein